MYVPKVFNLNNNLTVVIDNFKNIETVSLGIFTIIGSRIESSSNNGITHFLEHMLFKGTNKRSTYDISEDIESRGGFINAWTSKDKTAWYCRVIKEDVNLAVDILFDIFNNSIFPINEINKEKQVVIEEIKQSQDEPDDLIYDFFQKICYKDNSLSLPILGTIDIINSITQQDLKYHLKYYNNNNTVFVASGNIDEEELLKKLSQVSEEKIIEEFNIPVANHSEAKGVLLKENLNQVHIIVSYPSANILSKEYYIYFIISAILGKGMSSRLFKEIREKRGLVYSIYTFTSSFRDIGSLAIQAACSYNNAIEVIDLIKLEVEKLSYYGVSDKELNKAKKQLISSLYMSLESSYNRAERWAFNILYFNTIIDIQEITNNILNITKEDVINISKIIIKHKPVIAVLSGKDLNI